MAIEQITIVGLGLLGGSIGLAMRSAGFQGRIRGCGRAERIEQAIARGVIEDGDPDPVTASQGSDVVVLATPVSVIIDMIERLGPVLPERTLMTDVGSTKREILERARSVFGAAAGQRFLPGHPLAGKASTGLDHADAKLFRAAPWVFCPVSPEALATKTTASEWICWVETIGARPVILDAEKHDRICAWTSHLPQMIATALASVLEEELGDEASAAEISGRGLLDMTRLAASPYAVWRDILATNSTNIQNALLQCEQRLSHLREALREPQIREEFEAAAEFRRKLINARERAGREES